MKLLSRGLLIVILLGAVLPWPLAATTPTAYAQSCWEQLRPGATIRTEGGGASGAEDWLAGTGNITLPPGAWYSFWLPDRLYDDTRASIFSGSTSSFIVTIWPEPYNPNTYLRSFTNPVNPGDYRSRDVIDNGDVAAIEVFNPGEGTVVIDEISALTACFTPTPRLTPTPTSGTPMPPDMDCSEPGIPNYLCNGNFERSIDGTWELGPEITLDTIPPTIIANGSRRVSRDNNPDFSGDPYCADHHTLVRGTGLSQRFYWPGGTMYIQYRLRRKVADGGRSYPQVNITYVPGGNVSLKIPIFEGERGDFIDRDPGESSWQLNNATFGGFGAGYYDISFYNVDYEAMVNPGPGRFVTGTPPTPTPNIDPDLVYETRADYDFEVDDVFISQGSYYSYCSAGGSTITPVPSVTATRTPTRTAGPSPTRTPTRTPGPSPTPTNAGTAVAPPNFGNCNFEQGSAGWSGTNFSIRLSGGPIGPQYAEVRAGGVIYQPFTWSTTANAYFTFWIGPNSYGEVSVRNTSTNSLTQLWVGQNGATWVLRSAVRGNLPSGNYRIEARPYGATPFLIDGVLVARNTYAFCGSSTGNPVTPTSGPTAFITPTITRTPTSGPTLTPRPPTVTPTPGPTRTPIRTWTPGPTPTPSITTVPTNTPGNDATATAQASVSPSPTPPPTTTTLPLPPQQPEPQPYAECIRPTDPFNIAWWGEYGTCFVLTWFVWTPDNTRQLLNYQTALSNREPFGTLTEIGDTLTLLRDFSDGINWDNTGLACARQPVVADWIVADAQGLLNGEFEIEPGPAIASTCPLNGADAIMGTRISSGVCYATNLLCYYGIMQSLQLFVNGGFLLLGLAYIRVAWIAKATQS